MCQCIVWLRPNQSTMDRIRTAFAASKNPYYRASVTISRGKKSGHNPWQRDHQKAMDAIRGVLKRGKYTSRLDRWQNDEVYRASQLVHGWTKEYLRFQCICGQDRINLDPAVRKHVEWLSFNWKTYFSSSSSSSWTESPT